MRKKMSKTKVLTSFSGKFGDILWSLATVKHISDVYKEKVDFACMPEYKSLLGLIEDQPYISKVFVVTDWACMGSPHGDQPWQPPDHVSKGYQHAYHLGYRSHPSHLLGGPNAQLIDFIANQQGLKLVDPVVPFLFTKGVYDHIKKPYVSYAFNQMYHEEKMLFLNKLIYELQKSGQVTDLLFVDVDKFPWIMAADVIQNSIMFIGCRSANYVIAHGLGKNILSFEPHPERNATGSMGTVFGCSYGKEFSISLALTSNIYLAVESSVGLVLDCLIHNFVNS